MPGSVFSFIAISASPAIGLQPNSLRMASTVPRRCLNALPFFRPEFGGFGVPLVNAMQSYANCTLIVVFVFGGASVFRFTV